MPKFGTFKDTRDGKVYRTVLMPDGKWWSAENLAWDGAGVFYDNDPANGAIYGRLYTFAEALSSVPSGCQIPTYDIWYYQIRSLTYPQRNLASKSNWSSPGTDIYGFSAIPGGAKSPSNVFSGLGTYCNFWSNFILEGASYYVYITPSRFGTLLSTGSLPSGWAISVRFIVDSGNIPDPELADGITFTPRTVETPFRTESRNLRRFFVQGSPVFEAELKFDVDHSEIEAMDSWLESVGLGTFSRSAFAIGNADTIFQVLEPPTRSFSHKGMTVSMSVTATQDTPAYLPYPINEGVLPVCCPFPLSGQGSLGSEAAQLTEATGGRSTAKAFTASRGDRLSFTYATDKDGLAHFISWWSAILKCGHRGFFASIPGRTCWYFEFTEQPTFSLQSDLGKVTIKIQGRPTTKEITVTGVSTTISKTGSMNLTTNFSGTQRVVLVDTKNRLVDYALYSSGGFGNSIQLDLFGVPVGEYRWVIVSTMGMSKWFDMKVVN